MTVSNEMHVDDEIPAVCASEKVVHWIPCEIQYNGSCNSIQKYFKFQEDFTKDSGYALTTSFRGKLWRGFQIPCDSFNVAILRTINCEDKADLVSDLNDDETEENDAMLERRPPSLPVLKILDSSSKVIAWDWDPDFSSSSTFYKTRNSYFVNSLTWIKFAEELLID